MQTRFESMPGRYELLRKIATGGMAEIFLARQQGPQGFAKTLVVKRLLPHLAAKPDYVRMFMNEARLAALLNHPNVISVYDVGADEQTSHYFIAMEYLNGCSLVRLRKALKDRRVPPQVWAHIIAEACLGIHYAHELTDDCGRSLNIVHRDISLDNIVLTNDGQVKLVDFGIARAETIESSTDVGQLKGKFTYMAPETFLGKSIDRRTDIWAFGVALYYLIGGVQPFGKKGGAPAASIMHRVLHLQPRPLTELAPECSPQLARIIEKCLNKNPDNRYRTAAALGSELNRWMLKSGLTVGRDDLAAIMREQMQCSTSPEWIGDKTDFDRAEAAFAEDDEAEPTPLDGQTFAVDGETTIRAGLGRRFVSYMIELGLAALVFRYTFDAMFWASFAVLFSVTLASLIFRRATFGQALLGLEILPLDFGAAPWERGIIRFFIQHGWLLLFGFFVSAAYESSRTTETLGILACAGALLSWLGSVGALLPSGQGLHDRLTGVRVIRRPRG